MENKKLSEAKVKMDFNKQCLIDYLYSNKLCKKNGDIFKTKMKKYHKFVTTDDGYKALKLLVDEDAIEYDKFLREEELIEIAYTTSEIGCHLINDMLFSNNVGDVCNTIKAYKTTSVPFEHKEKLYKHCLHPVVIRFACPRNVTIGSDDIGSGDFKDYIFENCIGFVICNTTVKVYKSIED